MSPSVPYLCGVAAAMFLAVCLMAAAVRWFHMCRPGDRNPRFYYPGRPYVTAVFLNALVLIPYVLHPESADAWYLVRLYFLPVVFFHYTILLSSYFGSMMQWKRWRISILLAGLPVALALTAAFVLAVWPGEQLAGSSAVIDYILYATGLFTTGACTYSMILIIRWARRSDEDDFSNPEDFPVVATRRWLCLVCSSMALCWTAAIVNRPGLMALVQLLIAAGIVIFLITALHPHRNQPEETAQATAPKTQETQSYQRAIPLKKRKEILAAIRTVVEEQEAFLDPHLTLQDVADRSGYNRSYVAAVIKTEFGGFFNYVNRLRLARVDAYLKENPAATVQEAAEESGFASRRAYYAVRSKAI